MDQSSPTLALILGSLPAVAALLKVVWPSGERSLHQRVRRLAEIARLLPNGASREAVEREAGMLAQELAFKESARARRRWDGASIAAVVFVVVACGGVAIALWRTDTLWLRVIGALAAVFGAALVLTGLPQTRPVADRYRFQETEASDGASPRPSRGKHRGATAPQSSVYPADSTANDG